MSEAELFYQEVDKFEVYQNILIKERKLTPYCGRSTQLEHREGLISFILKASQQYDLHITTRHIAIQFLDRFLDECSVNDDDQLMLLAMACLEIAAKYEEKEIDIPRHRDLMNFCGCFYTDALYMKMELCILNFFRWNVGLPTVAHFSELFETWFVDVTDCVSGSWITPSLMEKAKVLCREYLIFFTDLTLKELKYKEFLPSLLSAAIIAAIRTRIELMPVWPARLELFTGYRAGVMSRALNFLLSDYERLQKESAATATAVSSELMVTPTRTSSSTGTYSSGYISRTPSPLANDITTSSPVAGVNSNPPFFPW